MTETKTLEVVVAGDRGLADCLLSRTDGGSVLDRGVRELVAADHAGATAAVTHHEVDGFRSLRTELESGASPLVDAAPDVVILTLAGEVGRLDGSEGSVPDTVAAIRSDLVAVIELLKERAGAHVLVVNVCTVDPAEAPTGYANQPVEPFQLRAHRLDLMLVGVSHDEGISIVDADRVIAEIGAGGGNVTGQASYGPKGCAVIVAETVRILGDYGFFDDRLVMAQVGARHAGT